MNIGWQSDATRLAICLTLEMSTSYAFADQPVFDTSSPLQMSRHQTAETVRACLRTTEGTLR
jgi:hypothetical protein